MLAILLEQPGVVVTREELQKRLWPNTFVDVDHNLNTAINKIREALGDSSENPRFVETLPRRLPPVNNGTLTTSASAVTASNQSEIKPQEFLAHRIWTGAWGYVVKTKAASQPLTVVEAVISGTHLVNSL